MTKLFTPQILARILFNTIVGIILVIFWMKVVDVNSVWQSLKNANLFYAIPFAITFILSTLLRSLRLKILLKNWKTNYSDLTKLTFLGQLLSFTIPIRAGEIAKGAYLATRYDLPFKKSLIWILIDRFLDFWLVLFISFVLIFFVPTNINLQTQFIIFSTFLLATLGFWLSFLSAEHAKKLSAGLSVLLYFPVLKKNFIQFTHFVIDSIRLLVKDHIQLLQLILLTFGALTSDAVGWYVLFLALNQVPSFVAVYLGSVLTSLTYLIPAAPGYVGSAEASGLAIFSFVLGFDKNITSATTVFGHALTLLLILLAGLISLYLLKFDLGVVWKKLRSGD